MKKILLLLTLLFFPFIKIYGQVNIEKYKNLLNANRTSGNISLYIYARTGNTDIQQINAEGLLNYSSETFHTILIAKGDYGWKKGDEFSNNALLHLRYIHNLSNIINPELFTQIDYNKKRKLIFRYLFGGGIRITLIKNKKTNFVYGTSYMFEHENLNLDKFAKHPKTTYNNRWNNYFSYSNKISKTARISVIIYAQPMFKNFSDIRLLGENHLSVAISEKFSVSLDFSLRYDSIPPDDIKSVDTNSKVGLTLNL